MTAPRNTTGSAIRGIILDYGEVLCCKPGDEDIQRMANILGMASQQFSARYDRNRRAYDRGDLTPEQYWSSFADESDHHPDSTELSTLRAWDVEMWSHLNCAMIDWLEAMHHGGFRTALLSNMHVDMVAKVRREFAWVKHLDFAVFSHEVNLAKPEAQIYEYCLQGLGTAAEETLFIDDREVNVNAAQALGIQTIRFKSVAQLCSELTRINFPVLPSVRHSVGACQE